MYLLFHEFDRMEGEKRLLKPFKIWITEITYYSRSDDDSSKCKLWLFAMNSWKDFEESYEQADEIITQAWATMAQNKTKKTKNTPSLDNSDDELDDEII